MGYKISSWQPVRLPALARPSMSSSPKAPFPPRLDLPGLHGAYTNMCRHVHT